MSVSPQNSNVEGLTANVMALEKQLGLDEDKKTEPLHCGALGLGR